MEPAGSVAFLLIARVCSTVREISREQLCATTRRASVIPVSTGAFCSLTNIQEEMTLFRNTIQAVLRIAVCVRRCVAVDVYRQDSMGKGRQRSMRSSRRTVIMRAGPSQALGRHFPDASIENTFMKKRMLCLAGLVSLAGMPAARLSHAEQGLLWELGAGAGAITLPDYLGSDVTKTHLLPIPYVTYRGEFFRVDRNGLRGLFFQSELLEVNLSMNLALGGSSRDNPARQGMADLKPTGEVGPTVDLTLWQASDQKAKLDFRMPVRAGITVESSPKLIGWLFSPHLQLALSDPGGLQDWHATLQAGPIFNSRRY
ncbi:MAG TPA: hypothetical protein DIT28_14855, partial [Oxalobacteraceae bacterium]|nr:hypothetical protein [Oxalobacteraceae bacterium]